MSSFQTTVRTNFSTATGSTISLASAQRRLHRKEFPKFYADLCHLQHSHPLQVVKINSDRSAADIQGDRIKFDEWYPIISALSWDQSLHALAIRLRHKVKVALESADTDLKARNVTKQPAVTTKFVLYWLVEALKQCLAQSTAITVLELDGLPMRGEYVISLAQGLAQTKSLQHLSLYRSSIGDEGAEVISFAVKDLPTLMTLDLSHCELTEIGVASIARLITHQKLFRYSEAWKGTLRYRDPDVDAMPGLRRLTLNNNPEIGDNGIRILIDELRDDLWLRAFDIQDTGITADGGTQLIHLIRSNPNLAIVDVRNNAELSEDIMSEILSILPINNDKNESEFKWISRDLEPTTKRSARRHQIRPWGKIPVQSSMRYSPKTQNMSTYRSSEPAIKPITKSHSSLTQKDSRKAQAQNQEVEYLKGKLFDLTQILNQEIKQKSQITSENEALKKQLIEKDRQISELESMKKNIITQDTIDALEKTLNSLAMIFPNNNDESDDESDIPHLLSNIKELIRRGKVEDQNNGFHHLRTIRREKRKNKKRHEINQEVIWEVDEEKEMSDCRLTERDSKENKNYGGVKKAQELFEKILSRGRAQQQKLHDLGKGVRRIAEKPLTSSEEESSY